MYNFDRMIVQAEVQYRTDKMRRGMRPRKRNRFLELHHQPFPGAPEGVERAR